MLAKVDTMFSYFLSKHRIPWKRNEQSRVSRTVGRVRKDLQRRWSVNGSIEEDDMFSKKAFEESRRFLMKTEWKVHERKCSTNCRLL